MWEKEPGYGTIFFTHACFSTSFIGWYLPFKGFLFYFSFFSISHFLPSPFLYCFHFPSLSPSSREYQIGVDIRRGRQQYQNTRVVTFVARYQLENRTGYTLAYLQRHQLQDEVKCLSLFIHCPPLHLSLFIHCPPLHLSLFIHCPPLYLSLCFPVLSAPISSPPFLSTCFPPFVPLSFPPSFLSSYSFPPPSPLPPQSSLFPRSFSTSSRNGHVDLTMRINFFVSIISARIVPCQENPDHHAQCHIRLPLAQNRP